MVGQVSTVSIPVRVLSSLQDELLALEVMVLITHPAVERKTHLVMPHTLYVPRKQGVNSRSALHANGTDVVEATLLDVAAL